ncbi:hypothetical protein ACWKSP_20405 [Micromonosporaceae bacterium Da 78-11]
MPPTVVPRALAGALTVALLAGCSALGGIRRPAPTAAPATTSSRVAPRPVVSPPLPDGFGELSAEVPVPPGYVQNTVQFVDRKRGYALFTKCGVPLRSGTHDDCRAALVTTTDGGVHWREVEHPEPVADSHRLLVGAEGTIALLAEPVAWYVSRDAGRTFARTPAVDGTPPAVHALTSAYEICCDPLPLLRRWVDGKPQTLDPGLSGRLSSVVERTVRRSVWVSDIDDGTPHTAFSVNEGRTWTPIAVDGVTDALLRSQLRTSPGGDDLWLLGWTADRSRLAAVWWLDDRTWRRIRFGRDTAYLAALAVGGNRLILTGPGGAIQLGPDQAERVADWPAGGVLRSLRGGGVQVDDVADGSTWLGAGDPATPAWTRIRLRPVGP